MVSALPKLGIPTIRSALPTRRTSPSPFSSSAETGGADGLDVRASLLDRRRACSLGCRSVSLGGWLSPRRAPRGWRPVVRDARQLPLPCSQQQVDQGSLRGSGGRDPEPLLRHLAGAVA